MNNYSIQHQERYRFNFYANEPNSNESHANEPSSPHSNSRCLIIFIICFIILIIFAVVILGIIFWPRAPKFTIKSTSVSSFCISKDQITAIWNISFLIKNPNIAFSVNYINMEGFVYYQGVLLSYANLTTLHQARRHRDIYNVEFRASSVYIENNVVDAMVDDWENGVMPFQFVLHTAWCRTTVTCDNVEIKFEPNAMNGFMIGGVKKCSVHMSRRWRSLYF